MEQAECAGPWLPKIPSRMQQAPAPRPRATSLARPRSEYPTTLELWPQPRGDKEAVTKAASVGRGEPRSLLQGAQGQLGTPENRSNRDSSKPRIQHAKGQLSFPSPSTASKTWGHYLQASLTPPHDPYCHYVRSPKQCCIPTSTVVSSTLLPRPPKVVSQL